MFSVFDLFSVLLLFASLSLFLYRYTRANPPVYPYLIIACACLVGNWFGESGGGVYAMGLFAGAAFSLLGCLLYPAWRSMNKN